MSEILNHAKFDSLRYAQVWEDADILIEALNIQQEGTYLSIASAGDNAFAILAHNPKEVIALDLNPIQLFSVELRAKMYEHLNYQEFLELYGARSSNQRLKLYKDCSPYLSPDAKKYWDSQKETIENGIASGGKFENYFKLFRKYMLPLVHSKNKIKALLENKTKEEREAFYDNEWNTWKWRWMFKLFFSKKIMGKHGRDKAFFKYVQNDLASSLFKRTQHALRELNPSKNSYLHWILTGSFQEHLPLALRKENFKHIKNNLHKLSWNLSSIEVYLDKNKKTIDGFNLSDIFEYMSEEQYHKLLELIIESSNAGSRIVYWNMMVERKSPENMHHKLKPLSSIAQDLHLKDKAFFYQDFLIEEVI